MSSPEKAVIYTLLDWVWQAVRTSKQTYGSLLKISPWLIWTLQEYIQPSLNEQPW